jgi:tRNA dimethylallyltransferase
VPAREAYSAGRFVADAAAAIATAQRDGRRPIIVGGTGLYFKALLEGLSPVPPIPDDVRQHWRAMEKEHGAYALYVALWDDDPEMAARLDPNDGQRIVRALEVVHATGKSLAAWQRTPGQPVLREVDTVRLVMLPERTVLNEACDRRFDRMMEIGALREAEALAALNLAPDLPSMRALGVRPLIAAARNSLALDDAVMQAKTETRHYAKRQMTWLKRNMITWKFISTQEYESNSAILFAFIQS